MSDIYIEIHWDSGIETYSFSAMHFSSSQSLPRLKSISDIIHSIRFDGEIENQTVTITLLNHDQYFNIKMLTDPFIIEKKVVIKNSTQTLFTGLVREMPDFTDENIFVLKVDIFSLIDRDCNPPITALEFPNAPVENLGKCANYVYGYADTYPSALIAVRIDTGKYLAARHAISNLSPVFDGDTEITDYTVILDTQTLYTYIQCNTSSLELQFSCRQSFPKPPPEHPWDPTPFENPIQMLNTFLDLINSPLQLSNYESARQRLVDRNHTGNLIVAGKTTYRQLFTDFAKSYTLFFRINRSLELEILFLEYNNTPTITVHPTYIKNFQKKYDNTYLAGAFTRKFHYLPATGDYKQTPADVIPLNPFTTKTAEIEQKFIIDEVTSWSLANRERYIREKPLLFVSFEIPKTIADQIQPGDYIYIKHRRHFYPNEYRKILIMRVVSNRKKAMNQVEGFDFSHIEMNNFKICAANDPELNTIHESGNPANHQIGWAY